ncbi:hypothetical protein BDQ12DRAFT_678825 [Crucibulum laeve]|uniref:Uncharacterized protein n=1 Tax=Crucibulum laeve TaxID=68775 RepID=A0A5C3M6I5_9AGAR|nr:hypothetical protein BDQ12DRAFT_678825 [Crucibulum laeve]
MGWQKTFTLSKNAKGCHLVTDEIVAQIKPALENIEIGMLFLFLQHTSAALTVNENFDKDVRRDMDMALDNIVPESLNWRHTDEGPDDSVSHTKTSLVGSSISIPITNGQLNLGTWQGSSDNNLSRYYPLFKFVDGHYLPYCDHLGIYLTEFRHLPHTRRVVATILS